MKDIARSDDMVSGAGALADNKERSCPWWRAIPSGWSPFAREVVIAALLYVVLALIFTFPLVLNFNTYLIGDMESDIWKHVWGMWWTRLHLVELGTLPLSTHLLNAPYGGALFFIDPLNALISVPLQYFWDMRIVYNLMVLFNLVLAAVGAFSLTRYLSGNRYAAFVGGVIYAFSAYMGAYINSGVTEAINIGWIPIFALFFIRMVRRNSKADAVRAAVFFSCTTMGSWYYGSFCVLLGFFYYVYYVCFSYRRTLVRWLNAMRRRIFRPWEGRALAALGTAISLAFFIYYLNRSVRPFEGDGITWGICLWGLLGATLLGTGVMRAPRSGWLGALWLLILPPSLVACLEARALIGGLGWGDYGEFTDLGLVVQALVVLLLPMGLAWHWRQSRRWQECLGLSAPSLFCLLSLSALALVSFFSLFVVLQTSYGQDDLQRLGICAACLLGSLLLVRHSLKDLDEELVAESLGGEYLLTLSRHYGSLCLLAILSIPLWRKLYPEANLVGFTFLFAAALWLTVVVLTWITVAYRILQRYLAHRWGIDCSDDWQLLQLSIKRWWHSGGGKRFVFRFVTVPCLFAVCAGTIIALPTSAFNRTINSEGSLVFRKRVAKSIDVHLSRRFRNVSNLCDYFLGGKTRTNRTYTVDKLTRVSYAGWVALILALCSLLVRRRQRNFWIAMVLVFMMFSLGPYLYITPDIYTTRTSFIYMAFFNYFPSFAQIAIPYRFVTMVMLSLAVLSSFTLADMLRRWPRRWAALLTVGLSAAVLFDVFVFSSTPFPIPLSASTMPEYCYELAQEPGEYGLIDYPIQRYKGELLPGEYFYYQMVHRKPLPNRVEGTIPLFVFQNAFTNYLFVLEHAQQDIPPQTKEALEEGLQDLARFRFRYLVIHNNLLRTAARERLHLLLRYYLGEPQHCPQNIDIYRIPIEFRYGVTLSSLGGAGKEG